MLFGHEKRSIGWITEVCKLNVAAQKRPGVPTKTVLVDDRKKIGMDSADHQNHSK